MFKFKTRKFINFLVFVSAVLFITSCGSDTDTSGLAKKEDVASLEQKVDQLSQQIDGLTSTTVTTESSTTAPTTLPTPVDNNASWRERCQEARDSSEEYLKEINAPEGFFFLNPNCDENSGVSYLFFLAYPGDASSIWHYTISESMFADLLELQPEGGNYIPIDSPRNYGAPMDVHHPAYPGAASYIDVMAADTNLICVWEGSNVQGEYLVTGFAHYVEFSGDRLVVAQPIVQTNGGEFSAFSAGLMPIEDLGVWSTKHTTLGACPAG